MSIKEQLTEDFKNILIQTEEIEFNNTRDKFLKTLFSNFNEEDHLDIFVGDFVLSCEDYLKSGFRESRKNILVGNFQSILIILDNFQSES